MIASVVPDTLVGTNCYVVAPAAGEECLVVDPGFEVLDHLEEVLLALRLRPAAVLLTHGHADHVWSVTPVCRASGVPALVHADDVHRLTDPLAGLSPQLVVMLEQHFGAAPTWTGPDEVRALTGASERFSVAGLDLLAEHAPGHTEGSAVFTLDGVPEGLLDGATAGHLSSTLLAGDVLFAGSIGRTDLPGGDQAAMERSLRDVVLPMPDDRLVLPGHGGPTTVGRERVTNPHLLALA